MAEDRNSRVVEVWVACGKQRPFDEEQLLSFVVDQNLDQPDMCVLTVKNEGHKFSNDVKHGDEVEVKIGGEGGTTIFKGEVVGIEPLYEASGESKCVVRAFNRMHRLLRGRKSRIFLEQSDQQIVNMIAQENGLSASTGSDAEIIHDQICQHNQTDLEFLRLLAARFGYEVRVEDKALYFHRPKTEADSGIELRLDEADSENALSSFSPRWSSAGVVEKLVEVTRLPSASILGLSPVFLPNYITGEGSCNGNPNVKPGIVVKATVNPQDDSDKFNGKYFVVCASHNYNHTKGTKGRAYRTPFRVRRQVTFQEEDGNDSL